MYQSSPEKRKQMQNYGRSMEDMTCIIDCGYMGSLFLGNIESATDLALLKKHRIQSIKQKLFILIRIPKNEDLQFIKDSLKLYSIILDQN